MSSIISKTTTNSSQASSQSSRHSHQQQQEQQHPQYRKIAQRHRSKSAQRTGLILATTKTNSSVSNKFSGKQSVHGHGFSALLAGSTSVRLPDSLTLCFQKALGGGYHSNSNNYYTDNSTTSHLSGLNSSGGGIIAGKHSFQIGDSNGSNNNYNNGFNIPLIPQQPVQKKFSFLSTKKFSASKMNSNDSKNSDLTDSTWATKKPTQAVADFEFRPKASESNNNLHGNNSNNNNGSITNDPNSSSSALINGSSQRSKSPAAIINRLSNFARGKYRNSMNEKTVNTIVETNRRVISKKIQKKKYNK